MTIKMIIATDCNFGIGKDNKLPWDCPEDLQYFKEQTENSVVVMGRKTFDSLPFEDGLPCRINVVISKSAEMSSTLIGGYFKKQVRFLCTEGFKRLSKPYINGMDTWIIGGASIYKELLPYVEEIHHTIIDGEYDCDTFFDMEFLIEDGWTHEHCKELSDKAEVNIWRKS